MINNIHKKIVLISLIALGCIINLYAEASYYDYLNADSKIIYDKIYDAIDNHSPKVKDIGDDFSTISDIYYYVLYDNPQFYYVTNKINYLTSTYGNTVFDSTLELDYKAYDKEQIRTYNEKLNSIKYKILFDTLGKSKFEIAKYCFDYLVNNSYYDKLNNDQSLISILIDGRGVCSSYAKSYKYLMDFFNIPCILVEGKFVDSDENHIWNMIELNNNWYHVDVTQADSSGNYIDYSYFCVDDKQIYKDHVLISKVEVNKAESDEFFYLDRLGLYFKSFDKTLLDKKFLEFVNSNESQISIIFDNKKLFDKGYDYLINQNGFINNLAKQGYKISALNYYENKVGNTLTFLLDTPLEKEDILFFTNFDKSLIRKMILEKKKNNMAIFPLVFEDSSDYIKAKKVLIEDRYVFEIFDDINSINFISYDQINRLDIKIK
ncbi:MAG: transglutaminase domain-containing protein [Pleomorphochaeta sp.]